VRSCQAQRRDKNNNNNNKSQAQKARPENGIMNIRQIGNICKSTKATRDHFTKQPPANDRSVKAHHTHTANGVLQISPSHHMYSPKKETNNRQRTKHQNEKVEPAKQPKDKMHKEKEKGKKLRTDKPAARPSTQKHRLHRRRNATQRKKVTGREHWVGLQKSEKHGNK
jgi:hypothetical protein